MKLKSLIFYLASFFIIVGASCQQSGINKNVKLNSEVDSASYAIGLQVGDNLKVNLENIPGGDEINLDILLQAFSLTLTGEEPLLSQAEADAIFRNFINAKAQEVAQTNLEEGNAFLESNKSREGVVTTESGIQYEILTEADGPKPKETDQVKVHYHGTLIDGTVFDSSIERGEPITFPLNGVIAGWTEALQLMPVGSKWKIYIPSDLAYGERGSGQIMPNTTLIFEVELLEIVSPE